MAKIITLPPEVYNLISAGEVVERPSSVVKELFENAVDAGASQICVSIIDGGISQIQITDNGSGMTRDDLSRAVLPHSTSKIKTAKDIDVISTLGFRGEALPSIASVSRLEIKSKTADCTVGAQLNIQAGVVAPVQNVACAVGTSITVSTLFYNTPSRAKFLKAPKQERAYIGELMRELALANPHVSVRYVAESKEIFHTFGNGLEHVLGILYAGERFLNVTDERDGMKINGFITPPNITRASRAFGTIIVNGRVVKAQNIFVAVLRAYGHMLAPRQFPIFVLDIILPFDEVDINAHPQKSEVRFRDSSGVFSLVLRAVESSLFSLESARTSVESVTVDNDKTESENRSDLQATPNQNTFSDLLSKAKNFNVKMNDFAPTVAPIFNDGFSGFNSSKTTDLLVINTPKFVEPEEQADLTILGQIFDTFAVCECGENLVFIDNHAAQERIIYDKLLANFAKKQVASQPLLVPITVPVGAVELARILEKTESLKACGFDLSAGENMVLINALPAIIDNINAKKFIEGLVGDGFCAVEDKIARTACRAAIKAGQKLSNDEILHLLKSFNPTEPPLTCPHGRPVFVTLTKYEVEKLFRRR